MVNIINTLLIALSLYACVKLYFYNRKMVKAMKQQAESMAIISNILDQLKEVSAEHQKMLSYLIDRAQYNTVMNKFMLSDTRLNFHIHRNIATQHEDYEGASMLSQSISQIEELLNQPD